MRVIANAHVHRVFQHTAALGPGFRSKKYAKSTYDFYCSFLSKFRDSRKPLSLTRAYSLKRFISYKYNLEKYLKENIVRIIL